MFKCLCAACLSLFLTCLALSSASAGQLVHSYGEDFTTMQYCDTLNTTAWWDTAAGEVKLYHFELTLAGSYDTPGYALGIAVSGDYAYVADYMSGFRVIDISDPTMPVSAGACGIPGLAYNVAVSGDYAYVTDGDSLLVIDISDPSTPTRVGGYGTPDLAYGITVSGDYAYVADYVSGIQVIDISDPTSPDSAGCYDTPNQAQDIAISGDYAYVADRDSVQVIDISDPTSPVRVGSYLTPGVTYRVTVTGDYLLVADLESGVQVVDISDPANPTYAGSYDTPSQASDVTVSGDYAYVADDAAGLHVLDISDPMNPILVGSYDTSRYAVRVVVSGRYAYVTDHSHGLKVIRIADPVLPPLAAGSHDTPNEARCVAISGDYAYVADRSSGLQVIDISDPTRPDSAGSYDTPNQALAVTISGDYAYVAAQASGLQVIDVSDPAGPTLEGSCDTPGSANGVAVAGDYAYVTAYGSGLQVIDINDPSSPDSAGSYDTPGYAWGVALSGDYAYVADGFEGLQVLDISNPASPTLAGACDTYDHAWDIVVGGDYAYIADGFAGLQVLDISDPTDPTLAGSYDTSDPAWGVALSGDLAYLATAEDGVHVIDISDPTSPTYESTYNTPGEAWSIVQSGDYAFVGDGSSGLQVIEVLRRRVEPEANTAQSLALDELDDEVLWARVTTTQIDSVRWELSANGGANWQEFLPNSTWQAFSSTGSDIIWKSVHVYRPTQPKVNPTCADLQIEWLYEFPVIESITDIPNDQGKQVSLSWIRNGHDFVGSATPIVEYAVYRKIDGDLSTSAQPKTSPIGGNLGSSHYPRRSRVQDIGAGSPHDNPEGLLYYPPGDWHFIMTVPACAEDEYATVIPTLADSTISEGVYYTTFFVRALTDTPGIHFDSYPDSGYSVDNLAPAAPPNLRMTTPTEVAWDEVPEEDFDYFTIYGSSIPDLDTAATLIGYTIGTQMDVSQDGCSYYHVTATDFSGNEGDASSIENAYAGVSALEDLPTGFALKPSRPNPFESSALISFDLPKPCMVRLEVLDVQGRMVRALINGSWPAGRHSVVWTGEDDAGEVAGPGVYFVRIQAGGFTARHKTIRMK